MKVVIAHFFNRCFTDGSNGNHYFIHSGKFPLEKSNANVGLLYSREEFLSRDSVSLTLYTKIHE